ncbi:MAG: hypothetical protein ACLRPT_01305 [Akkermansia muciniphila]
MTTDSETVAKYEMREKFQQRIRRWPFKKTGLDVVESRWRMLLQASKGAAADGRGQGMHPAGRKPLQENGSVQERG